MKVNDVLENAAIELVSSLPATVAVGRILLLSTNSKMYVGNASKKPVVMGHAVGEIRTSMLTLAQYQAEFDDTWVLANGVSAAGTDYNTITSESNIPDLRGRFLRGKNNGRTDGDKDPNGDLTIGSTQIHKTGQSRAVIAVGATSVPHTHNYTKTDTAAQAQQYASGTINDVLSASQSSVATATSSNTSHNHSLAGFDNETAPAYTVVNYFIKINR